MRRKGTWVVGVVGLVLLACGPSGRLGPPRHDGGVYGDGGDDGGIAPGGSFSSQCNGTATTITGAVSAPNSIDPVANAFVYVPLTVGTFPPGVACDLCGQPIDAVGAQAISGADGRFMLDISMLPAAAQVRLTVAKGRFRRSMMFPVNACHDNTVGAPFVQLPGKTVAGVDDIPKIAVATGTKDQLDVVLAAMGMDSQVGFDCYEGRKTTTTALTSPCGTRSSNMPIEAMLKNTSMLSQYNILFLACAPGKFASLAAADQQTITANLRAWTAMGGRLFATDNSYDYVAQAFPSDVMFTNGNTTLDAANVGVGGSTTMPTTYSGRVNDATLKSWLTAVSALPSGTNTIMLSGYLNHWSVIQSLPMSTADYVDATNGVAYTAPGGTTPGMPMSYPQTVSFDITPAGGTQACGRVIYTSYHTLPGTMAIDANLLAPQERILEYLMLEAGACQGPIG